MPMRRPTQSRIGTYFVAHSIRSKRSFSPVLKGVSLSSSLTVGPNYRMSDIASPLGAVVGCGAPKPFSVSHNTFR